MIHRVIPQIAAVIVLSVCGLAFFGSSDARADRRSVDFHWYCQQKHGPNTQAVVYDRWDAYTWRCQAGMSEWEISVADACIWQYGQGWRVGLGDRWDAYTWYCFR
ncbi:MAG: hypothetical protein ACPGOY_05735 [Rhodospirillaceae bacterium]